MFFSFSVYVRDAAYPALYDTTIVVITVTDVNDNEPIFVMPIYELEIPENTPLSSFHTVLANDLDTGNNADITYSFYSMLKN